MHLGILVSTNRLDISDKNTQTTKISTIEAATPINDRAMILFLPYLSPKFPIGIATSRTMNHKRSASLIFLPSSETYQATYLQLLSSP
jgi:hypothetical protein